MADVNTVTPPIGVRTIPASNNTVTPPVGIKQFDIADQMEQDKERSFLVNTLDEVFTDIPSTFLSGMFSGASRTADLLDFYATKISEKINMPKGGVFRKLSDDWKYYAEYFHKRGLPEGLYQKIMAGAGRGAWDVGMLMSLQRSLGAARIATLPLAGAAEGYKQNGPPGAIKGAIEGALMHGIFKGLGTLPRGIRAVTAAGTGAAITPGDIEEKIAGATLWTGMTLPGKGVPRGELLIPKPIEGIYQSAINRFQSIENLATRARRLGVVMEPGEDIGLLIKSYLGRMQKVRSVLESKTYRITSRGIEITGEGLKPILDRYDKFSTEKSAKIKEGDLDDFLKAKRYLEDLRRAKPGKEGKEELDEWDLIATPNQVAWSQEVLKKLNGKYGENIKVLENTANNLYSYQQRILHLLVDAGRMSQDTYNAIVEKNPHYIPLDRIITEDGQVVGGTVVAGGKLVRTPSPVRRIKGSEKEAYPAIQSVIKNTYRIMDIAERNNIQRKIASLAEIFPKDLSPVRPNIQRIKLTDEELKSLNAEIKEGKEPVVYRTLPFASGHHVINYYEDGKPRFMRVSRNLYHAMSGMNETSMGFLMKLMSTPARVLRTGATITPEFMGRNFIRDAAVATIQTSIGFKPFFDPTKAVADILGKTDIYYDWLRSGGAQAGFVETNRARLNKLLKEIQNNKSKFRYLNIINNAGAISQVIEQSTRLSVYKNAIRRGYHPLEAARMSREATVDFGRRGSGLMDINRMIAFFNAGVQGLDKTIRTGIQDPIGTTVKGTALITIPSVLSYLLNRDDPEYKQMPRWLKDLFWTFKVGKTWVRVPKPFLYGQIFGSSAERFLEYVDTRDPEALEGLFTTVVDAALPSQGDPAAAILPTAVKPVIENITPRGWSFFKQREIVPASREKMIAKEQHGRYTSETAKLVGGKINYSPSKIENFITGWTGGTGRYALELSDELLEALDIVEPSAQRPSELADVPVVKGFVARPPLAQPESMNKFYREADRLFKLYNTFNDYIKKGKYSEATKLRRKYPELFQSPLAETYRRYLAATSRQMDQITESKTISEEDKRRMLEKIEVMRLNIVTNANRMLKETKRGGKK